MSEEGGYIYLPDNYVSQNQMGEMLGILTPIINVDEKNTSYCGSLLNMPPTIKYDVVIKSEESVNGEDGEVLEMKRYERLKRDILRKKMARSRETLEQRDERLKKDRLRKKNARQNETPEQRKRRLEKDRIRIQQRRAMESHEERRKRLERNRLSKRISRVKETSSGDTSDSTTNSLHDHGHENDSNVHIN